MGLWMVYISEDVGGDQEWLGSMLGLSKWAILCSHLGFVVCSTLASISHRNPNSTTLLTLIDYFIIASFLWWYISSTTTRYRFVINQDMNKNFLFLSVLKKNFSHCYTYSYNLIEAVYAYKSFRQHSYKSICSYK